MDDRNIKFQQVIEHYKSDISSIRTGRASSALVEDIQAECYGQKMRLVELATITTPEPRTIVIQPWDKGVLEAISKAIRESNLGMAPIADGDLIRLNLPALTEERRKEFIKLLKQKTEHAHIQIRRVREEVIKSFADLSEDEQFRSKADLQKTVDEHNKKLEELEKKKEGELMQ